MLLDIDLCIRRSPSASRQLGLDLLTASMDVAGALEIHLFQGRSILEQELHYAHFVFILHKSVDLHHLQGFEERFHGMHLRLPVRLLLQGCGLPEILIPLLDKDINRTTKMN